MNRTATLLSLILLILTVCSGCVQRRLIIRSQPEGAFVTVDQKPIGRTPLSVPFTYYATRDIKLEKDGYKTVKVQQRLPPKWYQMVPFSLISENFAMREIRDERLLDFQLEPKTQVQDSQLIDRANDLRFNINRGTVTGLPGN